MANASATPKPQATEYNQVVKLSRKLIVLLVFLWVGLVLYPDPRVIVRSVGNTTHPRIDAAAAAPLAATLPDDPRLIEEAVLGDVIPYAYDWQVDGVPWYFPSTREALAAGRGDCESRAVVLASVLAAKGIPYELRMSFDHIWVDYPGKVPNAIENADVAIAERRGGRYRLHWPKDFHPWQELKDQVAIYWTPMPTLRRVLLLGGMIAIPLVGRRGLKRLRRADTAPGEPPA